jgi:hypothetical protein
VNADEADELEPRERIEVLERVRLHECIAAVARLRCPVDSEHLEACPLIARGTAARATVKV